MTQGRQGETLSQRCGVEHGTLSPWLSLTTRPRGEQTSMTQFMDFLTNADEIVGNLGKSEKTIDNPSNSGTIVL